MTSSGLAQAIAFEYARLPMVSAVALAGSRGNDVADADSDIDLYVYTTAEIPLAERAAIARSRDPQAEVGNAVWEPGDEWIDLSGAPVDVMFRSTAWIEAQLERVLVQHQASVGYSTCFWHNVRSSIALFDRTGWFAALQQRALSPYPEPLRRAIVHKNFPILDRTQSAYTRQLERAVRRGDAVSVNHRVAALLASYFDVLFAVNRLPHPGEKRLADIAEARCRTLPDGMRAAVDALLDANPEQVVERARTLVAGLERVLAAEDLP